MTWRTVLLDRQSGGEAETASESGNRAASPAVAVIFLAAISILLAATVGLFPMTGQIGTEETPNAVFELEQDGSTLTIAHTGGDTIDGDNLRLVGAVSSETLFDGTEVSAGTRTQVSGLTSGTVSLVWESPDGDGSTRLASHEVDDVQPLSTSDELVPTSLDAPSSAGQGEQITVNATLTNNKQDAQTQDVQLLVDGTVEKTNASVTVPGDGTKPVNFTYTVSQSSGFQVTIKTEDDSVSGSVAVGFVPISDWNDLNNVRNDLDGDYKLVNELNSSTAGYDTRVNNPADGWDPIGECDGVGSPSCQGDAFEGTFDGQGNEIHDLVIDRPDNNETGLFGGINDSGEVRNVGIIDADVTGKRLTGTLVGAAFRVKITESYATGSVNGSVTTGGLAGGFAGTMSDSYASVTTTARAGSAGGLVGGLYRGQISQSYADGDVSGPAAIGGLVGVSAGGTVTKSNATGDITGGTNVGGLVGIAKQFAGPVSTINNSYATGTVSSSDSGQFIGGLVGQSSNSVIRQSYAVGDVNAQDTTGVGGLVGVAGGSSNELNRSYATGDVDGNESVGGLVGEAEDGGVVSKSYAVGNVTGKLYVGGIAGRVHGPSGPVPTVEDSYWEKGTTNQDTAIGDGSGTNLEGFGSTGDSTPAPKMTGSNATSNMDALDFPGTWETVSSPDDDYPVLAALDRATQLDNR